MINHNKKIKSILTDVFNHQIENIERNKSILNEQLCDIVTKIYECKGKLVITGAVSYTHLTLPTILLV